MYKIKIFTVGKTKEPWLHEALSEYHKRLKTTMGIEWILAKNQEQLTDFLSKESVAWISLDPKGRLLDSLDFSKLLFHTLEKQGSHLNFVIGDADGLAPSIKEKSLFLLSLSPLTFTHQITRLVLLEQLYRAREIEKRSPYHK